MIEKRKMYLKKLSFWLFDLFLSPQGDANFRNNFPLDTFISGNCLLGFLKNNNVVRDLKDENGLINLLVFFTFCGYVMQIVEQVKQ